MDRRAALAAASRDGHLALRRVERQQALIERLHAAHGTRLQLGQLARDLGVSVRTVSRDVERLRLSGVPLDARRGQSGGVRLLGTRDAITVVLDLPEAAALMSSLAVLGPTATESAASAMRKMAAALDPANPRGGDARSSPAPPNSRPFGDHPTSDLSTSRACLPSPSIPSGAGISRTHALVRRPAP